MIILSKIAHETIWGGTKLKPYVENNCEKIGHLYSLFDDIGQCNLVLNGEYSGKTFHEYFKDNRDRFGLGKYEYYPLVLAIVEAADNLSIQVHPGDDVAKTLEGAPWGKNESWYFINKPSDGFIFDGCKLDSIDEVREFIDAGRGGEISDTLDVEEEDYVFVESGTLHAITRGSLVYEIEENSEYTYRFYDFDRRDKEGNPRELHIDKAMKALNPSNKSNIKRYDGEAIEERMYSTNLVYINDYKNTSNTLECITILDFNADYVIEGLNVGFGQTIVLEPGDGIILDNCKAIVAKTI